MTDKYSLLVTLFFFINVNWSSCSQVPVCLKIRVLRIAVMLKLLESMFEKTCILLLTRVICMNNMFITNLNLYVCGPLKHILPHTLNYF